MANNPRGTRHRDGAAQLSQYREEFRLFGPNSSDPISAVFEVWNEPTVVKIFGIAPGQAVAIDQVSDYSGSPVYAPFTPVRGQPLELTEDLTAVILFYPGRYVLRLTAGGLGTIQAFAYPFSVSHDWGDYYGGLGLGGNVVTSIDETDTNTINITLTPDPGVGDVNIRADAVLSPNAGNILQFLGNGMFVQGPDNGPINVVPTSVLDTATIDMTLAANVLSAVVIRSPDAGQILQLRANGVYVPGPQTGNPIDVPTMVLDTASVDLTLVANVLSADVIISPNAGNQLQLLGNGLFVSGFAGTITSANDTASIDHTVVAGVLTSDVIISPNAGNQLTLLGNGLFVAGFAGTITSATDTNTIDHTVAAGVLSSQAIISPNAGNTLVALGNGLYVPTPSAGAVTSVADTLSIDLTLAVGVLSADLRIDPSAENVLNLGAPGVLVEAATTTEEEAETAGDLVITASVLGHIVNARTASQSAHLGVNAGNVAGGQVALGHNSGTGVVGLYNISAGVDSGQNVTGNNNIYIGYLSGPDAGTNNAGRSQVVRIDNGHITNASRWANGSVMIGAAYGSAANTGSLTLPPTVVAIGYFAAENFDFNGETQSVGIVAIGAYAAQGAKNTSTVGITAIGPSAGAGLRADGAAVFGYLAGGLANAAHIGTPAGTLDAFGVAAGAGLYNHAFSEQLRGSLCFGTASASNARFPSKTYVFDTSKIPAFAPIYVELVDPFGATAALTTVATNFLEAQPVPTDLNTTVNIGPFAAADAHIAQNTSLGNSANARAYNFGSTTIGYYAGTTSAHEESVDIGFVAGLATKKTQCVTVGAQAGSGSVGAAICANFTGTAFNGTNTYTVPVHTLAIGEYHVVEFNVVAGTAPTTGIADGSRVVVYALNNTTLVGIGTAVSAGAVGTFQFLEITAQVNNVAIGYKSENTFGSNNIRLGNDDSETITTAAKIFPGTDGGAVQTTAGMYAGTGAPNNANGNNGDFYFRADGGAMTTIYHKRAGAWVGVV